MQLKIKNPEDFWSGLMFIGFGLLAIIISRDYPIGSAMRMGPGYFPMALGGLLMLFGAIITVTAFRFEGEAVKPFAWHPIIYLALAFVLFGWGIDRVGFVPSLAALVVLSSVAGREFKLVEVIIMAITLIVGSWALFIHGLELPYPLFWWR